MSHGNTWPMNMYEMADSMCCMQNMMCFSCTPCSEMRM